MSSIWIAAACLAASTAGAAPKPTRVAVIPQQPAALKFTAPVVDALEKSPGLEAVNHRSLDTEFARCRDLDEKCVESVARKLKTDVILSIFWQDANGEFTADATLTPLNHKEKPRTVSVTGHVAQVEEVGRRFVELLFTPARLTARVQVATGEECTYWVNGMLTPELKENAVGIRPNATSSIQSRCSNVTSEVTIHPGPNELVTLTVHRGSHKINADPEPVTAQPTIPPPLVKSPALTAPTSPTVRPSTSSAAQSSSSATTSSVATHEGGPNGLRIASYVSGGVGVALLAVGVVEGLQVGSNNSKAKDASAAAQAGDAQAQATVRSAYSSARSAATVRDITIAAGGAAVVAGAVMFFLSPSTPEPSKPTVGVAPLRDGVVVGLNGNF